VSNVVNYQIVKRSDREYIDALKDVSDTEIGKTFSTLHITFYGSENQQVTFAQLEEDQDLQGILNSGGQVFFRIKLTDSTAQKYIQITRQSADANQPNQLFDAVAVSPGQPNKSPMDGSSFARLLVSLQNELPPVSSANLGPLLGPGVEKHFAAREEALNRLEGFVDKMVRELESTRKKRDDAFIAREKELTQQFHEREKKLDTVHKERLDALDNEKKELERLKSEIDDRSSTHARRDIRKELKEIVGKADRLKNTPETGRRRFVIGLIYLVLLALFGTAAGTLLFREFGSAGVDYWQLGRQAIFSIAFAVTAGFFLRWLNCWTQQMADEELRQKQFELDLDRASWLVEMALEWKSEKGEEIPEHLLTRLSHNLFGQSSTEDVSMTASDALASAILGTAAKAKISVPGAEVEIDRSGLKKLKRTNSGTDA